ncbi:hypothetical protein WHR41_09259 [Cladosporium halotolerans]|uniref:tyrosinase n=1 Tax=Cladosporium halotolerans TaxID=1052096 RepID=A0AB34KA60_9PEZI
MKFSSLFCTLSVASSVFAHSSTPFAQDVDEIVDEPHVLEERQSGGYVAVTGVNQNAVYPRLEVRQMLFTKPNQWTLFVLGLQRFQQMSQNERMSYYQIAGIHGVPRQNWDGVGQCSSCRGTDGYCTHDSVLFPAWHRAYLALFEQAFMNVVNDLARSYPDNRRAWMTGAASTMRFPYWDWAAHPAPGYPALPNVMSDKYISVETPTGMQTIINPLFRHDFQNPRDMVYTPFINWQVTLRYPNSNSNTASSVTQSSTNAFNNIRASLQDQVYQLFSTCRNYAGFAGDTSSNNRCSNSLEGIHNTIHTTLGGPGSSSTSAGHMTYLSTAAFDPGFWLHHMMVDRLFALWQGANPNSFGASQASPHATWTIPAGQVQNANSPLTPFHRNTNGDFWTSNGVRDWKTFKYTYPEFANTDGSPNAIMQQINRLYGPGATATAGSTKRTALPEPQGYASSYEQGDSTEEEGPATTASTGFSASFSLDLGLGGSESSTTTSSVASAGTGSVSYNAGNGTSPAFPTGTASPLRENSTPLRANNGSSYQYICHVQTPRYALNGSYSVFLFNGEPENPDPTSWSFDKNLIGPAGVLAQPGMTEKNITAYYGIPITRTLVYEYTRGGIADLTPKNVDTYLQQKLRWKVAGPQGQEIDHKTIPGFKVEVFSSTAAKTASDDELPEWSEFIPLHKATEGLPTCSCEEEDDSPSTY